MFRFNSLELLLCFITTCFIVTDIAGYCMRPGYPCYDGVCAENKTCICNRSEYVGHDCVLPTRYTLECNNTCSRNGQCYFKDSCYCDFGYFGSNCEYKNETIECHTDYMRINLNTDRERSVFLKHHKECEFTPDGMKALSHIYSYSRDIPLEPTPGSICDGVQKSVEGNITTYTVLIEVKADKSQIAPFDYVTEMSCSYELKGVGQISLEDNSMYAVGVLDGNGYPIVDNLSPSSEFSLAFWPTKKKELYEIGVMEIRMIDRDTSKLMYEVISKGCATHSGEEMLAGPARIQQIVLPSGLQQSATVVPFLPLHQAYNVLIDYKIQLCLGRCNDRQCSGKPLPVGSKGIYLNVQ